MLSLMPIDHHYHRDEHLIFRVAVGLGVVVCVLAIILAVRMLRPSPPPVQPADVWAYISTIAPKSGLDPEFVYAIAWAESSLQEKAGNSGARGMMQITRVAWNEVTDESYRHAWDWRTNLRIGIDYLAFCRDFLQKRNSFSYPLLAACYRYGPYYVQNQDFDIDKIQRPKNDIYKRIFDGEIRPVPPPVSVAPRTE